MAGGMVGVVQRSDVPWLQVQQEYEAGATLGALERRYSVTRQAIAKRQKRGGWTRSPDAAALAETATAKRLVRPRSSTDKRMARGTGHDKRSLALAQRVLDMAAAGATMTLIAKRIGMSRDGLADWLKSDPAFAAQVEQARAERALSRIEVLDGAAERGDWRAAAWLIERDEVTREDFTPAAASGPTGAPVVVSLVLPADLAPLLAQPWVKTEHPPAIEYDPAGDGVAPASDNDGDEAP